MTQWSCQDYICWLFLKSMAISEVLHTPFWAHISGYVGLENLFSIRLALIKDHENRRYASLFSLYFYNWSYDQNHITLINLIDHNKWLLPLINLINLFPQTYSTLSIWYLAVSPSWTHLSNFFKKNSIYFIYFSICYRYICRQFALSE